MLLIFQVLGPEDKWQRPRVGMLKINVDAAVSKVTNSIATGAIARDDNGVVRGILLKGHTGINSPRVAEAIAIREGLNLGIAMNVSKVIIESDAESIVKSFEISKTPASDIVVLVQDCLELKNSFGSCQFNFVKRGCNRAAHDCARKALSSGLSGLWTSTLPPWGSLLSDV